MRRAAAPTPGWPSGWRAWLGSGVGQTLDRRLDQLYQRLPVTTCQRQGHCCSLLPPLQPAEIIAWMIRFAQTSPPRRTRTATDLVRHFLLNAAQRRACPWARPGACADYAHRFLACRAYGLWSPAAYQARRRAAEAGQAVVVAAWAGLGVRLPEEVLTPGPEYCRHVRLCNNGEKRPNFDELLCELEAAMTTTALGLGAEADLAAMGGDLAHLVARLALGERECLEAKVAVTRAWVAGRRAEALGMVEACLDQARAWSLAAPSV
jgi:hypothetical protein